MYIAHTHTFFCRLKELERNFVLDCIPLSKLANDEVGRTKPSLNIGIPQYLATKDPGCKNYFKRKGVGKSGREAHEQLKAHIMPESSVDKFLRNSSATKYLSDRKKIGAGMTYNFHQVA